MKNGDYARKTINPNISRAKAITVGKLIEELRQYPKDSPVLLWTTGEPIITVTYLPPNDVVGDMVLLKVINDL